jgi:ABC-2 type transport system permease protein
MAAIYILWLREVRRQIRSKTQILGVLGKPLLYLFALGFGLSPIFARAGEGSYIQFLAPGLIGMTVLFSGLLSGMGLLWDRQFGFLQELLAAPVRRSYIILGRALGGASIAVFQGAILFAIACAVGFRPASPLAVLTGLLVVVLIAVTSCALGAALGCRLRSMATFPIMMNLLIMPLFFLSGAFFPLDNLPAPLKAITVSNPLSYAIDGLRSALIETSHFGLALDIGVLAVAGAVLLVLAGLSFSKVQL